MARHVTNDVVDVLPIVEVRMATREVRSEGWKNIVR